MLKVILTHHDHPSCLPQADVAYIEISSALAVAFGLNWVLFDRTRQGVALAAVCAVGAPLSELVLLQILPLWSYPQV